MKCFELKGNTFSMVLFDMDGCLIDSEYLNIRLWAEVFEHHQVPIYHEEMLNWRGWDFKAVVDRIEEAANKPGSAESFRQERDERFWKAMGNGDLKLKPFVLDILNALDKNGIPYACVTSTHSFKADKILKHFEIFDRFKFILTGDTVQKLKPNPELYLKAIAKSDVPREEILVFEDSKHGIKAALSASLNVVYIIDRDPIDIGELDCLGVVENFSQILEQIQWKEDNVV